MKDSLIDISKYEFQSHKDHNFIFFHPFSKNLRTDEGDVGDYCNWSIACEKLGFNCSLSDLHVALCHYYFGSSVFNDQSVPLQSYYHLTIEPVYLKLKSISAKILPKEEQLDFVFFKKIIDISGFEEFEVRTLYDDEPENESSKAGIFENYVKYKSWELRSLDENFYFKSLEDDVITYISFNDNSSLLFQIMDLKKRFDIIQL